MDCVFGRKERGIKIGNRRYSPIPSAPFLPTASSRYSLASEGFHTSEVGEVDWK